MKIKIDDIHIGERRRKEMGDVTGLAADLQENGQITAITVRPPTEIEAEFVREPYMLVAGGRRTGAAMLLGWEEIEAFTREDPIDELKHRVLELHENLQRLDMTWAEVSQAKMEMLTLRQEMAAAEGKTITQEEVARELGDSVATFSRDIKVAKAIEANPELKGASSRKAAQRAHDMDQEFKQRMSLSEHREHTQRNDLITLQSVVRTQDASEFLRTVPPRSVDLLLTDPPYGIDYWKSGQKTQVGRSQGMSKFDDSLEPTLDMLTDAVPLWVRSLKDTGWAVVFISQDLYGFTENLFKNCCSVHCDYRKNPDDKYCMIAGAEGNFGECKFLVPEVKRWIWYRPNSRNRPRFPYHHAMNFYEDILVVNMGKGRLMIPGVPNLLICDAEYGEDRIHANQKPVDLAMEIVKRLTMIGDTVMDTCFGSGALLAGAAWCGRRVRGCDTNANMLGPALGLISRKMIGAPNRDNTPLHERDVDKYGTEGAVVFDEIEPEEEADGQ